MVYWFKRRKDGEYLPYDSEKAAWKLLSATNFSQLFEYVGRSSGQKYQGIISGSGLKKFTQTEAQEFFTSGIPPAREEEVRERGDITRQAIKAELEEALTNPDKVRPRNFDKVDLSGVPYKNVDELQERMGG